MFFQKEIDNTKVVIDIFFDSGYGEKKETEDSYNLEIFLRTKDTDEQISAKKSHEYLQNYLLDDYVKSKRGYKLKNYCSKKVIKEQLEILLNTSFN